MECPRDECFGLKFLFLLGLGVIARITVNPDTNGPAIKVDLLIIATRDFTINREREYWHQYDDSNNVVYKWNVKHVVIYAIKLCCITICVIRPNSFN